jgi:hypothetical protein
MQRLGRVEPATWSDHVNRTLLRAILISALLAAAIASAADARWDGGGMEARPAQAYGQAVGGPVRAALFRTAL